MLARRATNCQVWPYGQAVTIDQLAPGGAATSYEYINVGLPNRCRQGGRIVEVVLPVPTLTNLTGIYVKPWRLCTDTSYVLVGKTENLIGKSEMIAGQVCTVPITTEIDVRHGDFIGAYYTGAAFTNALSFHNTANGNWSIYRRNNVAEAASTHNWSAETPGTSICFPIGIKVQSPHIVVSADSVDAGWPHNVTAVDFVNLGSRWRPEVAWLKPFVDFIKRITGEDIVYQNLSIGGQTSAQGLARIADVTDANPRYCVWGYMNNDINNGVAYETWRDNCKDAFDVMVAADIIPIMRFAPPCTGWNNTKMTTRDAWKASFMADVVPLYPTLMLFDPDVWVGQFRAGGAAGNLWDQVPAFAVGDGQAHFNDAGHAALARGALNVFGYDTRRTHWALNGRQS